MNPDEREEKLDLGGNLLRSGQPQQALDVLNSIPIDGPSDADTLNLVAVAYNQLGQPERAEAALRRALELMPHHPEVLSNLAQYLSHQDRLDEAQELLTRALRSRPDHAMSRTGHGLLNPAAPEAMRGLSFKDAQGLQVSAASAGIARCHIILDELYAHRRSLELGVGIDINEQPQPIYTYPLIEYLRQFDYSDCLVLEWGSGNSTRWWAQRCQRVTAVEHDPEWVERLRPDLPENVELLARDNLTSYVDCFGDQSELFDIIIVDGLYRFDCAQRARSYLKADGMVILDNSDWHAEAARALRDTDLIQVDFAGFKPTHDDIQTTSIFLSRNYRPKLLFDTQPLSPVGSHFLRKRWDRSYR